MRGVFRCAPDPTSCRPWRPRTSISTHHARRNQGADLLVIRATLLELSRRAEELVGTSISAGEVHLAALGWVADQQHPHIIERHRARPRALGASGTCRRCA